MKYNKVVIGNTFHYYRNAICKGRLIRKERKKEKKILTLQMMITKISTLNLCLGLRSKKDEIERLMINNSIDILCMQETEIDLNHDTNILSCKNYNLEVEVNSVKVL